MQEWKIRQEIYHRLTPVFDDDLNTKDVEISEDIVNNAVRYFKERDIGWIYPAKSYMVGICYAKWLAREFGGQALEYLDDHELLYKNDPYFTPYSADSIIYNQILEAIGGWEFNEDTGMVPDVYQYFLEEFQIGVM
jgi:hypothetical protein